MSTLVTYTFDAADNLSGVCIRGYACGRYLNNSGVQLTRTISTLVNNVAQCQVIVPVNSNAVAIGWRLWSHFYVEAKPQGNGVLYSIGSNIDFSLTYPQATATLTGNVMGPQYLQLVASPYAAPIPPGLTVNLALAFDLDGAGRDSLEVHVAYLEAL